MVYFNGGKKSVKHTKQVNHSQSSKNNIHPNFIGDKSKEFSRLGKPEMIAEMNAYGFTYSEDDSKPKLVASFKKQLRKSLK